MFRSWWGAGQSTGEKTNPRRSLHRRGFGIRSTSLPCPRRCDSYDDDLYQADEAEDLQGQGGNGVHGKDHIGPAGWMQEGMWHEVWRRRNNETKPSENIFVTHMHWFTSYAIRMGMMIFPFNTKGMTMTKNSKLDLAQIADHRKKLGVNQQAFWSPLGVTQSGGSRYESGRNLPKPVALLVMLRANGKLTDVDLASVSASIAKAKSKK